MSWFFYIKMIARTHLAIGIALALFFLPHVKYWLIFIPVLLIASLLPDIDSGFSYAGKRPIFRPVQLFTKHRGFIHSLTLCIFISIIFAFYFPVLAFPFFLGYSFHLLADSFTVTGIRPFWPFKGEIDGNIRAGGRIEDAIFFTFVIVDLMLFVFMFI